MANSTVKLNGTTIMTVADTTSVASDVAQGEYFYGADGVKTEGTYVAPSAVEQATPTITVDNNGLITATATQTAGVVSAGTKTATEQLTVRTSSDMTASGATVTAPAGYYVSAQSKSVSTTTHPDPSVTINSTTGLITATHTQTAGYVSAGTSSDTLQLTTQAAKTVTPSTSSQTAVSAGRYTTGAVTVAAMPSGTEGTPVASKGAVSNHSIAVTPSVTNTAGYIAGSTKTGTAVTVSASELVSGTLSATTNDTYDVTNYASVEVDVPIPTFTTQTKTVSPTESQQTVTPDTGYDGLSEVTVNAISSTYVGTDVTRQSATTITPSASSQIAVSSGTYVTGNVTVSAMPTGTAGTPTATKGTVSNHSVSVTPSVTNTTGYITGGTKTGTAVSVAASELVSGTLSITANDTYDVTNYENATVAVPIPTFTTQTKSVNPTESQQTVTPDSGYDGLSQVTVGAISSTYVGSNVPTQGATTITPSTSAQTAVSSGTYVTGNISVSAMPSGSAGTPTATKGTVSNHSVSVTPSVTNSTGYITGGTKTGTAVTVSASELVSGTLSVTSNGTADVTNYASIDVNVSGGGGSGVVVTTSPAPNGGDIIDITAVDLSSDTVSAAALLNGYTAHDSSGNAVTGTYVPSGGSSYTLLGSQTFTTSTTSTSNTSLGQMTFSDAWDDSIIVYVKVRDTAGARSGYFYGSDTYFFNYRKQNNSTSALTVGARAIHRYSGTSFTTYAAGSTTGYGVFAYSIANGGVVNIYERYNSTYSLTVDGTYLVEVYALTMPDGESPYEV